MAAFYFGYQIFVLINLYYVFQREKNKEQQDKKPNWTSKYFWNFWIENMKTWILLQTMCVYSQSHYKSAIWHSSLTEWDLCAKKGIHSVLCVQSVSISSIVNFNVWKHHLLFANKSTHNSESWYVVNVAKNLNKQNR